MGELPGIIQGVFGVVALIAGGVATTLIVSVRTLRESIGDRDKRIEGLEGRVSDLESQLTKEQIAHAGTVRDMETMGRMVTGEAHLVSLESRTEDVHTLLVKIDETVRKILTKLGSR